MQGVCKFFDGERFYGFIETPAGDVFFHGSSLIDEPVFKGDVVEFDLAKNERDDRTLAVNVRRAPEQVLGVDPAWAFPEGEATIRGKMLGKVSLTHQDYGLIEAQRRRKP